jgi:O-antigen ligase
MHRFLLVLLFAVLLLSDMFGWRLGISTGLSVKNAFLYTLLLMILVDRLVHRPSRDQLFLRVHLPFLALIVFAVMSWLFTDAPGNVAAYSREDRFIALKGLLIDFYLFFVVYYFGARTLKDAVALAKFILLLVLVGNVVTVMDVYDMPDLGIIKQMEDVAEYNEGRLMGPLGEPNQYGAFLNLFLPAYFSWALARNRTPLGKTVFLAGGVVTIVCLLLTGSRGGYLGLVAGLLGGFMLVRRRARIIASMKAAVFAIPAMAIAVAVVVVRYSDLLRGRIEATTKAGDAVTASAGRLEIWESGLNVMADNPLSYVIGMGWHTFAAFVGVVPHNTFLWYFFGLGAVGLVLYLIILRNLLFLARSAVCRMSQDVDALLIGFVFGFTALLASVCFVDLFAPWYFIWAYVGIIARISILMNAEAKRQALLSPERTPVRETQREGHSPGN